MCLATSNNLLLMLWDAPKQFFATNFQSSGQTKNKADTFFHPPSPFPSSFCNCNSGGICPALQLYVQLPLLYTAWSNAYSEISLEVTLWPLTSYVEDYKGHSLAQTSFTEPPNSHRGIWSIRNVFLIWLFPLLRLRHTNHRMNNCTVLNTPAVSKNALRNVVWHWCAIHCPRLACPSIERRYLLGTLPDHRLWEQWLVWVQEQRRRCWRERVIHERFFVLKPAKQSFSCQVTFHSNQLLDKYPQKTRLVPNTITVKTNTVQMNQFASWLKLMTPKPSQTHYLSFPPFLSAPHPHFPFLSFDLFILFLFVCLDWLIKQLFFTGL